MVERLEGLEGLNMLREAFRQVCLQRAVAAFWYRVGYCKAVLVDVDVLSGFGATLEVRTMKIGEVHGVFEFEKVEEVDVEPRCDRCTGQVGH